MAELLEISVFLPVLTPTHLLLGTHTDFIKAIAGRF
jgi:hypothetical protein